MGTMQDALVKSGVMDEKRAHRLKVEAEIELRLARGTINIHDAIKALHDVGSPLVQRLEVHIARKAAIA